MQLSPEDTIMNLRSHIDRQEKRERYLDHKIGQIAKEAKDKLATGDKRSAVQLMKKRKLYQNEQVKISNVKMTLETQAISLESAATTAEAFQAMSAGTNTMKKIRADIGVDQVDDMMMDIQEEMQMADEVNTAIGQSIDPTMGAVDDDDLMKELEEMEQMDLESEFNHAEAGRTNSASMPQVPSSGLSRKDEEDYRKLQAELAM